MNNLEKELRFWQDAGFTAEVVDAPKEALTFNKMLIVFSSELRKSIKQVSFYSSETNKFVANF